MSSPLGHLPRRDFSFPAVQNLFLRQRFDLLRLPCLLVNGGLRNCSRLSVENIFSGSRRLSLL